MTGGCPEELKEVLAIAETDFDDSGDPGRQFEALLSLAGEGVDKGKVVEIAECGLDYNRLHLFPTKVQQKYFEKPFELAYAMKLPMFLHMRAAAKYFCNILERSKHRLFYGIRIFDPGVFVSNIIEALSGDADWSLWRLRQQLGNFYGQNIAIQISHLEGKVVFNDGRVDRVLDLANIAEDHLQYFRVSFILFSNLYLFSISFVIFYFN